MTHKPIETINYKGFSINIYQDDDCESPDNWENNDAFIVYDHRQFNVERKGFDPETIFEHIQETKKFFYDGYFVFPLYAYIHSGVSLSLGNSCYPFTDRWDVSTTGFVLVKRAKYTWTRTISEKLAQSIVNVWNDYLSGNVYGFQIEDKDGNDIDSCWGFYGNYNDNDMLTDAKSDIDCHIRNARKSHFTQLKTWIKNRVPLYVRKPLSSNLAS